MKMLNTLLFVFLTSLASFQVHAQVLIEVFTDGPTDLDINTGMNVIHYDLSEPQRIKQERAPKFPPDIDAAKRQAQVWFDSPAGLAYQAEMKRAYRGQQLLVSYRLLKTPAIVFDSGKYVVYGTTDINKAGQLYLDRLRQEGAK